MEAATEMPDPAAAPERQPFFEDVAAVTTIMSVIVAVAPHSPRDAWDAHRRAQPELVSELRTAATPYIGKSTFPPADTVIAQLQQRWIAAIVGTESAAHRAGPAHRQRHAPSGCRSNGASRSRTRTWLA
jgi:hypothetical protein